MGGKNPGKLLDARTASRTLPLRNTTGSPVSRSVATTTTGTRSSSKVATGRNSSMSVPSFVPDNRPPPHPRTHIQGCSREAWSSRWSRSAPPAHAAATSAPPLTLAMPATSMPARTSPRMAPACAAACAPPALRAR
jgi:hypothetical protein